MAKKAKKSFVSPRTSRNWMLVSGMVRIPIGMTKVFNDVGSERMSATNLCPEHELPITQPKVCRYTVESEVKGKVVTKTETHEVTPVKGYEYEPGKYAVLTDQERSALPAEHGGGTIELKACIKLETVDASLIEGSYFSFPLDDDGVRGYAGLLDFLVNHEGEALVGEGNWYGSTRAYLITAEDGVVVVRLCNYLANFKAEVKQTIQQIELPELAQYERSQAEAFFGGLPSEFDWGSVTDDLAERQHAVIAEKITEGTVTIPEAQPEPELPTVDIFETMRAEAAKHKKAPKAKTSKKSKPKVSA